MKVYNLEDFIIETEKDLPFTHKRLAKIRRESFERDLFDAVAVKKNKFLYDELKEVLVPKLSSEPILCYESKDYELIEISPQENNRISFRGLSRDFSKIIVQSRFPDEDGIETIGQNVQVFDRFPNGAFLERKPGDQVFFQDLKPFEMIRHEISTNRDEKNIFTKSEFQNFVENNTIEDSEIYIVYEELPFKEDGSYQCDVRIILFQDEDLI